MKKSPKPRYWRVVLLLTDEPTPNEKAMTKAEVRGAINDIRMDPAGLEYNIESLVKAEVCRRCDDVIGYYDSISGAPRGLHAECWNDIQYEREEEEREARRKAR